MWTHSVQSDLDGHCPQKLLVASSVRKAFMDKIHKFTHEAESHLVD